MANIAKEAAKNPEGGLVAQGLVSPKLRKGLEEPG